MVNMHQADVAGAAIFRAPCIL